MKTNIKKVIVWVLIATSLFTPTYAAEDPDLTTVKTHINNMRSAIDQSGIFWEILTKVFDNDWKIRSLFYDFLGSLARNQQ